MNPTAVFRVNLAQYFPQDRQFLFTRAFGARDSWKSLVWGAREKRTLCDKRSWHILSVCGCMSEALNLRARENVKTVIFICSAKTPQWPTKLSPAAQRRISFPHVKTPEDIRTQARSFDARSQLKKKRKERKLALFGGSSYPEGKCEQCR